MKRKPLLAILLVIAVMIGGVSSPVLAGDSITSQQLLSRIEAQSAPLILDVRRADEYASGHVPGAINIPHKQLKSRIAEIMQHKQREVAVYCEAGVRANFAQGILEQAGFAKILHLEGDMRGWRASGLPQER